MTHAAEAGADTARESSQSGIPDDLRAGIESLSGMDMSGVLVHTNSSKPAQLNVLAYAQGNDIYLVSGQERHLPHEAWHVVQLHQGRVKPTMQLRNTIPVNDPGLEHEADGKGHKASANLLPSPSTPGNKEVL